jgi:hypothetical protein
MADRKGQNAAALAQLVHELLSDRTDSGTSLDIQRVWVGERGLRNSVEVALAGGKLVIVRFEEVGDP